MNKSSNKRSRGRLFVISAPSGAGKTTLVKKLLDTNSELRFSVSHTTRRRRRGEVDGRDYFFVTTAEFAAMRGAAEFLENAEVFGNFYGTGREQVEELLNAGHDVLLEIDWQGARQVRENMPDCESIFIVPPGIAELERRLRGRSTDSDEVIARRLSEALGDLSHWSEFDYAIFNDDLEAATEDLLAILAGEGGAKATANAAVRDRIKDMLSEAPG